MSLATARIAIRAQRWSHAKAPDHHLAFLSSTKFRFQATWGLQSSLASAGIAWQGSNSMRSESKLCLSYTTTSGLDVFLARIGEERTGSLPIRMLSQIVDAQSKSRILETLSGCAGQQHLQWRRALGRG